MSEKDDRLLKKLKEYADSDMYPFHMPGHKRRDPSGSAGQKDTLLPYRIDITEIDGFDNLHHAEGILKDAMDYAAEVYGSDRTYFLVNGSTCGILAAICAATVPGSSILMARNSHVSAYNALILGDLDPVYILPAAISPGGCSGIGEPLNAGIPGSVDPSDVEKALQDDTDHKIRAVFIVSPTYEGIVSDVTSIAAAAHSFGIPLIVDEAHGAHLNFAPDDGYFPRSALSCGADIVIQSLHKTLPALTQTAVMHIRGDLVGPGRIEQFLNMFESSSPSYILMASIDECIRYMNGEGRKEMERYEKRLKTFYSETSSLKTLRVPDFQTDISSGTQSSEKKKTDRLRVYARDPSKIVILAGSASAGAENISEKPVLTGSGLAAILRENYHIETEMSAPDYVIAMTSLMDTDEGFERLITALQEIDSSL